MDQTLLAQMLSGGGVLAFAIAVWLQGREHTKALDALRTEHAKDLGEVKTTLAKLEERSEAQDRRAFAATPPMGVPLHQPRRRKHNDTDED